MKTIQIGRKILITIMLVILILGTVTTVFAESPKPTVSFTDSGVAFNEEIKLLRFNLEWSHPGDEAVDIMYSINDSEVKKLGTYNNQNEQIIAHIYIEDDQMDGDVLNIYAIDNEGNKSDEINSQFKKTASQGITISDGQVPLSVAEGTWSLINLFLTALSVVMVAVSAMLFLENKSLEDFKNAGRVKSTLIAFATIMLSGANIAILIFTQNLKLRMVMIDDTTISVLAITILSIVTTMILAARAFNAQAKREMAI